MSSFFIGIVLGLVHFGGLYFTVQTMSKVKYPSLFMGVSFVLRMGLLLGGFFYLLRGDYKDILYALAGVILIRFIMIFTVKSKIPNSSKRGD